MGGLSEVVQDHEAFIGFDVEEILRKIEGQYCGCETRHQRRTASQARLVRILEAYVEVLEAASLVRGRDGF
jgi:hypothetical protein